MILFWYFQEFFSIFWLHCRLLFLPQFCVVEKGKIFTNWFFHTLKWRLWPSQMQLKSFRKKNVLRLWKGMMNALAQEISGTVLGCYHDIIGKVHSRLSPKPAGVQWRVPRFPARFASVWGLSPLGGIVKIGVFVLYL
jgi:hypothetical protein